jgi:hypothetical protein
VGHAVLREAIHHPEKVNNRIEKDRKPLLLPVSIAEAFQFQIVSSTSYQPV